MVEKSWENGKDKELSSEIIIANTIMVNHNIVPIAVEDTAQRRNHNVMKNHLGGHWIPEWDAECEDFTFITNS